MTSAELQVPVSDVPCSYSRRCSEPERTHYHLIRRPGEPLVTHRRAEPPSPATHRATGALVSTETLTEACRTLGECTPDYCAGASEPPTCRYCYRLDIEEPCLLDPIRQEAEGE